MNAKTAKQTTPKPERTEAQRLADRAEDLIHIEKRARERFDGAITTILARLETLATDIRRAQAYHSEPGVTTLASKTAEQIQHAVLWGLANLDLDGLTRQWSEADTAGRDAADERKTAADVPIATWTCPDCNTVGRPFQGRDDGNVECLYCGAIVGLKEQEGK